MKNKRACLRLKRDWDVEYQIFKDDLAGPALNISGLLDVGGGGFCFKSDSLLGAETLIQFAIKLKEDLKPIIGVARTVWSQVCGSSFKTGVHFVWVSWKGIPAEAAIGAYVHEHSGGNSD
jgi:hypothetical protein